MVAAVDSQATVAADVAVSKETVVDFKVAAADSAIEVASEEAHVAEDSLVAVAAETLVASLPTSQCPRPRNTQLWCSKS